MSCKPRQFRPYHYRPKRKSEIQWRSKRVIRRGKDKTDLRKQAWERSGGYCENDQHDPKCPQRIFWDTFHLHHIHHRALGGSDVLDNVQALSRECHYLKHEPKRKAA